MNELTKKLQQVMVPKAALIAYEYSDGRYGHGTYYLELHPINDRGRMEAAVPVTYEFMDSLVEYYTDNRQDVPHGKIPTNMLWCDTRKGHERPAQDCAKIAYDLGLRKVKAYVKGPGNGRESAIRTIHGAGIEVTEIIDVTPLPHNGCRPPKRRRV